jgi:hypothetical protein
MKSIYQKNREGVLHATWTSDSTDHGDEDDEEEEDELDLEPKQNNQHKYCGNKIQEHRYSQLLLLTEVDFPGGDLSSGPSGASTSNECCIQCSNNNLCVGFTFVISARQCWLKKNVIQRVSNTHTVSGILPFAEAAIHKENDEFERLMREHRENDNDKKNNNNMNYFNSRFLHINFHDNSRRRWCR